MMIRDFTQQWYLLLHSWVPDEDKFELALPTGEWGRSESIHEAAARLVQDQVMKRKEGHKGTFLTFREEFLHVASMLKNPLLVLIVGQGGLVKSVQLSILGPGLALRGPAWRGALLRGRGSSWRRRRASW